MKRTEPDPRRDPAKSWDRYDTMALVILIIATILIAWAGNKLAHPPCQASEEQPAPAQRPCNWRSE